MIWETPIQPVSPSPHLQRVFYAYRIKIEEKL